MTAPSAAPSGALRAAAASHRARHGTCAGPPRPLPVWRHLDRVAGWLDRARSVCRAPPPDATKAAEWLLDNEHHVRRAARQVRQDMPPAFYRRLCRAALPEAEGAPRIFLAAQGYLDATHSQVDTVSVVAFLDAYQREEGHTEEGHGAEGQGGDGRGAEPRGEGLGDDDLTLAELWAFPVMIRLAALEEIMAAFARLVPEVPSPVRPAVAAEGDSGRDATERLSRAIVALAAVERIDWKAVVEATSRVEAILRAAPDGLHAAMDFDTRDRYRQAIEDLAEGSGHSEAGIARAAVRLSRRHLGAPRRMHVGWWLVGGGRPEIEALTGYRAPPASALRRAALRHPGRFYAAGLLIGSALALALPLGLMRAHGAGPAALALGGLLLTMPASILAVTLVNWIVTQLVPPRILPKMEYRDGLPKGAEAAVIVPAILRDAGEVGPLLARLERHMLTNPDTRLRYALLTDPADAAAETTPRDAALETALAGGIRALNGRHPDRAPFVLLHRRRRWNAAEGVWMGWERKRGKIEEFNEFLHGGAEQAFSLTEGDVAGLRAARFVVTLDADTIAPPGSVRRLVGALAHPLNRAEFDSSGERVVAGYTFVQPRIEISPEAGAHSPFTRLYTGDTAIDIYSRAVSDVYQDLFGEGIFTGKGAYDAAAFRRSLRGRVPENALVSHDLFEGLHGRAALASDVVLYEGFPRRYPDFAQRLHRWIRGDWQLLPWLGRHPPGRDGTRLRTPLTALDRWKIVDNLRRSLIAPALVLLVVCGWLAMPGAAPLWTLLTVAAPGTYLVTYVVGGISRGRRRGTVQDRWRQLRDHIGRWALEIAFMADEAVLALDAVSRTLWRLAVSRRRLLEWATSAHVAAAGGDSRARYWRDMAAAPLLALAIGGALAAFAPAALSGAAPLLAIWIVSPEIAYRLCQPWPEPEDALSTTDRAWLRRIARRTWAYFEACAGPGDHWLAPDNLQVDPEPRVAHRSSPTNVGMQFLSMLTAQDLGHIGLCDLAQRTAYALDSLERIERHRGHPVNWFDTRSLLSLEPRYVSTVDSGNLAVALLTLREGLVELADGPVLSAALWDGLVDTLGLLSEAMGEASPEQTDPSARRIRAMAARAEAVRSDPQAWRPALKALLDDDLPGLSDDVVAALDAAPAADVAEAHLWLDRSRHHAASFLRDLDALFPEGGRDAPALSGQPPPDTPPPDTPHQDTPPHGDGPPDTDGPDAAGRLARTALRDALLALAERAGAMAAAMDFSFLYDRDTRTFFLGYNLSLDRIDEHRYDLLASEARLASYVAIAKGDVPTEHWFHLGRPISRSSGPLTVLSWNGSMFEFLMPALVMRSSPAQLLGQSERAAVDIQRQYGARLGLPWGVSEAAFSARDAEATYQYRAFGVPGLGMRQGLAEDYVVAPYASALALAVRPADAVSNLRRLAQMGLTGRYGFYDAVDFTPSRIPEPGGHVPVRTFMAHHQGMLLAALGNALRDDVLVRRFGRNPRLAAIDLLQHERVPWEYVPEPLPDAGTRLPEASERPAPRLHGWPSDETGARQIHTLGNGRLSAWVTDAGTTTLWWHRQSLTRWVADPSCDAGAARLVLHDPETGPTWEFRRTADCWVDVMFHAEKASFHLQHHEIAATQEICVAATDDVEIRHVTLVNNDTRPRVIEVTSIAEPVLAPHAAHERHPAFSKLFVHGEILPEREAVLFTRRPRRPDDTPPVMLHALLREDPDVELAGMETDRRALLGRHGAPLDVATREPTGMAGWTLDPAAAIRARVRLAPGERARFAFLTAAAASRAAALETAERYATAASLDWALADTARAVAVGAGRFGMSQETMADAQRLAGHLLQPATRPAADLSAPLPGQPDLWGLGVSGDLPVLLVRVADADSAALLPSLLRAHRWLGRNGLRADLVVLGTKASSYEAQVAESVREALRGAGLAEGLGGDGGVHLHSVDRIAPAQLRALEMLAALALDGAAPTLAAALPATPADRTKPPVFSPGNRAAPDMQPCIARPGGLVFDNGLGGFDPETGDYVVHLEPGRTTPVPWSNVLANDGFGTIVTEAGLGFTWCRNSGEFRLTPWSNDPVTDAQGEALYLRDEESGQVWTVTPLPAGDASAVRVTHAPGETVWERASQGLAQRLSVAVSPDAPVKLVRLAATNATDRARRVTATLYAEWQLGATPSTARPHVRCGHHAAAHALVARNGWSPDFSDRVAFVTADRPAHAMTADRAAFLGPGGTARPEGLRRWGPWGRTDAVADPCAVYQVHLDIAPGATERAVFLIGAASSLDEVERLAARYASSESADRAVDAGAKAWDARLGALQVETPDPALDLLVNRWLPTQAFASRILARAGFQQASGGIGYRDQLQDMMAFLHSEPRRVRAHILDCARHQFEDGDVLHWWHPPGGRGVRTRCSDDMLWLVYATHRYVRATGDNDILRHEVPFLSAPPLGPDEEDRYAAFARGAEAPLVEHCLRAMERGDTRGAHGLPLIGSGDWNDGMDRVGHHGRGESVWLAWFAAQCGDACAELAERAGRGEAAALWRERAAELRQAAETAGWDGGWYRRAFDDEGEPWGSAANDECRIDSIAQSWAVLGAAPDRSRAEQAVRAAADQLVDPDHRLVRLLAPPFDRTPRDPGYIRAYPPGVRENGGQYTHAATWLGLAFARLGDGDTAWQVFDLINPIRRSATAADIARYRGEPYVMAADVGGAAPFEGRAGWTWYTGAASWSWRLAVEGILGLELRDGALHVAPCLPRGWGGYRARVQGPAGAIEIDVGSQGETGGAGPPTDAGSTVRFPTDGSTRHVRIGLGPARSVAEGCAEG